MTIFNWLATTWGSDNQEEVQVIGHSSDNDSNNYSHQEPELEQKSVGMFDWIFGSSEQNYYQESEPTQTHYQEPESEQSYSQEREPEQRPKGMFDWFWGNTEQEAESEPVYNSYRQTASESLNIQGDDDFEAKVTRAYNYLDAEDQAFVRNNTSRILQHKKVSGAFPISKIVMLGGEVLERDERSIAGVLVHEAKHNTNGPIANSQQEELDCIARQIQTLKKIGGCEAEIAQLEKEDGLHYLD